MRINLNIDAANAIASELPDIAHMRFSHSDDAEYVLYNIKGGIHRLKNLSPVDATSRQLWLRGQGESKAFDWLAKYYGLFEVPKKVGKTIAQSAATC